MRERAYDEYVTSFWTSIESATVALPYLKDKYGVDMVRGAARRRSDPHVRAAFPAVATITALSDGQSPTPPLQVRVAIDKVLQAEAPKALKQHREHLGAFLDGEAARILKAMEAVGARRWPPSRVAAVGRCSAAPADACPSLAFSSLPCVSSRTLRISSRTSFPAAFPSSTATLTRLMPSLQKSSANRVRHGPRFGLRTDC